MYKYLIILLFAPLLNSVAFAGEDKPEVKTFNSYPVDASVTKDKFRWLVQAGAQRIVCSTQLTLSSFSLMFQKKKGVEVKIVVINSTTGAKIKTLGPYKSEANGEASSWEMDYLAIELSLTLSPGSYFIYPQLIRGKLAYLPNYNRLNRVDNKFKISPGMFTNSQRGAVWDYKFDEKAQKSETALNDYGPFLKWVIAQETSEIAENDTARIEALVLLVGREEDKETAVPSKFNKEFAEMNAEVTSSPTDKSAYNSRGAANSNIGNYSAAVRDFTVAIELDSSDVVAITNRGITYAKMKEYKLALKDFDEAIAFDNRDPLLFYIKGYVERQLGKYNAAVNDFSRAAALNPRDPLTFYMRGRTKMDQKDYEGALSDFDKALVIKPGYWAVYKYRGLVNESQGKLDSALVDYSKAVLLNDKDSTVFLLRAKIYEKMNLDSLAAHDYQQIILLEKDNLLMLQKRGEACVRAGMNKEAISAFDQLLKVDPTYYDAYYFRGLAKFQIGETSNACGDWTIAQHKPTEQLKEAIKKHCKKYDTKLIK